MTTMNVELVKLITTMTESVGLNKTEPNEAVSHLQESLVESLDFSRPMPVWHWTNCANDLLAELIPEKASVFVPAGDCSGTQDADGLESESAVKIVLRAVMRGLEMFDSNDSRKNGASKVLDSCPNPIAKSATPFVDSKSQWNHTHVDSGEEK